MIPRLFVFACFAIMGWAYWTLSGGASFRPEAPGAAPPEAVLAADEAPVAAAPAAPQPGVATRADTSLDSLADVAPTEPQAEPQADPSLAAAPSAVPDQPLAPDDALAAIAPELAEPVDEAVAAALAEPAPEQVASAGDLRRVTGDSVNMRDGPGTDFAVVGRLTSGDEATVIESAGGWARVRAADGSEGWMSERFLAPAAGG